MCFASPRWGSTQGASHGELPRIRARCGPGLNNADSRTLHLGSSPHNETCVGYIPKANTVVPSSLANDRNRGYACPIFLLCGWSLVDIIFIQHRLKRIPKYAISYQMCCCSPCTMSAFPRTSHAIVRLRWSQQLCHVGTNLKEHSPKIFCPCPIA
mgnify:CR=1 FL=1